MLVIDPALETRERSIRKLNGALRLDLRHHGEKTFWYNIAAVHGDNTPFSFEHHEDELKDRHSATGSCSW